MLKGPVIIASDGLNATPGHNVQYLTHSLLDISNNKIVILVVVDCHEIAQQCSYGETGHDEAGHDEAPGQGPGGRA